MYAILVCRKRKCRARVNGPKKCRRPVTSLSNATKLHHVNRPLLKHDNLNHHHLGLSIEEPCGLHGNVYGRSKYFPRLKLHFLNPHTAVPK